MLKNIDIFDRLILAGGPPRSGTTLLTNVLNDHANIVVAMDNKVKESWGLYYYKTRVGLIKRLREENLRPEEAQQILYQHLIKNDTFLGVAPSKTVQSYPLAQPSVRPDLDQRPGDLKLKRHLIPTEAIGSELSLCLKSPEISFVLPELSLAFPKARFVLCYRPAIEIAESMYRKGYQWGNSYHVRWNIERDQFGDLEPPPGVIEEWFGLWKRVSDFQRCVIYASSYLRAIVLGIAQVLPGKAFIYNHKDLCANTFHVIHSLADFLEIDRNGFLTELQAIRENTPALSPDLMAEYEEMALELDVHHWMDKLHEQRNYVS